MSKINSEFVPYSLALRMKALGYDEPCFGAYGDLNNYAFHLFKQPRFIDYEHANSCVAPTWHSAFAWFREKYDLEGESCRYNLTHSESKLLGINKTEVSHVYIVIINGEDFPELDKMVYYTSKEEAELACLEKLIEIVEQKEKGYEK